MCAVVGDEDEIVEGHRQEALLLHPAQLKHQSVVETRRVQQHHRFVVQTVLALLQDVGRLVECPEAAGHHHDRIGSSQHQRLAFGEILGDHHLVGVLSRPLPQEVHRYPDEPTSRLLHSVGDDFHQPGIGSTPHQGVAALAEEFGEVARRPCVSLVEVGGR